MSTTNNLTTPNSQLDSTSISRDTVVEGAIQIYLPSSPSDPTACSNITQEYANITTIQASDSSNFTVHCGTFFVFNFLTPTRLRKRVDYTTFTAANVTDCASQCRAASSAYSVANFSPSKNVCECGTGAVMQGIGFSDWVAVSVEGTELPAALLKEELFYYELPSGSYIFSPVVLEADALSAVIVSIIEATSTVVKPEVVTETVQGPSGLSTVTITIRPTVTTTQTAYQVGTSIVVLETTAESTVEVTETAEVTMSPGATITNTDDAWFAYTVTETVIISSGFPTPTSSACPSGGRTELVSLRKRMEATPSCSSGTPISSVAVRNANFGTGDLAHWTVNEFPDGVGATYVKASLIDESAEQFDAAAVLEIRSDHNYALTHAYGGGRVSMVQQFDHQLDRGWYELSALWTYLSETNITDASWPHNDLCNFYATGNGEMAFMASTHSSKEVTRRMLTAGERLVQTGETHTPGEPGWARGYFFKDDSVRWNGQGQIRIDSEEDKDEIGLHLHCSGMTRNVVRVHSIAVEKVECTH